MSFLSSDVTIQGQEQIENRDSPTYNQEGGILVVNGMDLTFDVIGGSVLLLMCLFAMALIYKYKKDMAVSKQENAGAIATAKLNKYRHKQEKAEERMQEIEDKISRTAKVPVPVTQRIMNLIWGASTEERKRSSALSRTSSMISERSAVVDATQRGLRQSHQMALSDLSCRLEEERSQELAALSAQFREGIAAMEERNRELRDRLARLQASLSVQSSSLANLTAPIPSVVGQEGEPSVLTDSRMHRNRWAAASPSREAVDMDPEERGPAATSTPRRHLRVSYQSAEEEAQLHSYS